MLSKVCKWVHWGHQKIDSQDELAKIRKGFENNIVGVDDGRGEGKGSPFLLHIEKKKKESETL